MNIRIVRAVLMLRLERENLHMGFDLHSALSAAGLTVERIRAEANVLTPTSTYPIAAIIRAVPGGPVK